MSRRITTSDPRSGDRLRHARRWAYLLDAAFRIPGTQRRFGLDPLLGLVPGAGDALGAGMAGYLLWLAARAGAPPPVLVRMFGNLAIDALVGAVPLLGDLFDAGWKANLRNLRILEHYVADPKRTTAASYLLLGFLLLGVVAIGVGAVWLAITALRAVFM